MGKEEINAFLGAGTEYTGRLQFNGAVRIDGKFNGDIVSDGALIVGKDAIIEGTLNVGELLLAGNFKGKADITRRTTIHKTGVLQGVFRTPVLSVEEGAILDVELHMTTPEAPIAGTLAQKKAE